MITREIDRIAVYGKTEGLSVYELIGSVEEADGAHARLAWITQYEEGLLKYREPTSRAPFAVLRQYCVTALTIGQRR